MTRPHEDLQRHQPADHRPGGAPIRFEPRTWCAIDTIHVRADRVSAGISAYETLIEKAKPRVAAVLRSANDRRVFALLDVGNHETFHHLQSAWDDHKLFMERHAVAESTTLGLYQVIANAGDTTIDPDTKDAYAFEQVRVSPAEARARLEPIQAAEGFRGAFLFGADDSASTVVLYRFDRLVSSASQLVAETASAVHPVRTFG
jgi:hypothetical protein